MCERKLPVVDASPEGREDAASCLARREFFRLGMTAAACLVLPRALAAAPVRRIRARTQAGSGAVRYPIPSVDGVHVDRDNEVILVRHDGMLAAFALSCPHQRSLLRWREKDGIFRCTKHHSEYSAMGKYLKGRATRNMDRLAIQVDGNDVLVDPGTAYHSDDEPQAWATAEVPLPEPPAT